MDAAAAPSTAALMRFLRWFTNFLIFIGAADWIAVQRVSITWTRGESKQLVSKGMVGAGARAATSRSLAGMLSRRGVIERRIVIIREVAAGCGGYGSTVVMSFSSSCRSLICRAGCRWTRRVAELLR